MIAAELLTSVEAALGESVRSAQRITGGDINDAFELELRDGRGIFLKTNARAPARMFECEARGLTYLAQARALRVPQVLAHSSQESGTQFLLLELLRTARPRPDYDVVLGRGLAALHRAGATSFGFDESNFIGRLTQTNRTHPTWAEFYREERLEAQLRAAVAAGRAPPSLRRDFERLFVALPGLVGDPEPPARLHGDLWSGNVHVDEQGAPCLIDPAVYGGHREMDLAMMRLFGGFSERVFSAYAEAFPLAAGHAERVALYQLYPLLVHLNLFGGSYASSVQRTLSAYI